MDRSPKARFARWVKFMGLSEAAVARMLECDRSYPSKLMRGTRRPGLKLADAIERLSAAPREDGKRWREKPIRVAEWLAVEAQAA